MSLGTGLFAPVRYPIRGIVDREDTIPLPPFPPIRCPICEILVERKDYLTHRKSLHPAYMASQEKTTRNFIRASVVVLVVLVLDILLLRNSWIHSWVLPLVIASYAAVLAINLAYSIKVTRRFKRTWKEQNPEAMNSNTR
jgi:hypothetical protein